MKPTLPDLKSLSPFARHSGTGHSGNIDTEAVPEPPKPPPELSLFFMLSHLEEDGPVRLDGVKLAVSEVMGLELDEPKLGAFAGSLNALDFPVQLLVRQHPPVLQGLRVKLNGAQPEDLPRQTRDAADSLGRLLAQPWKPARASWTGASTPFANTTGWTSCAACWLEADWGYSLWRVNPCACSGCPPRWAGRLIESDEAVELEVEVNRRDIRIGERLTRSLHLGKWPRSLAPGFLQGLMATGAPMDLSVHLGAIPGRAGGPHPGMAEGPLRVGAIPVLQAGPFHVPRGGDRPGGREQAAGTRCSGAGSGCFTHPFPSPCTPPTRTPSRT